MFSNTGDWLADQMKGALGNVWDWVMNLIFGWVPWWVWAIIALLLIGWAWKTFGWQGLVAVALGAWTFFVYRAGFRAGHSGAKPVVPVETMWPEKMPPAPKAKPAKKRKTLQDLFTRKSG